MFYFEQLLLTALSGIDSYNITSTVLGVAGTILLLSFLYSAYQAFAMGGDVKCPPKLAGLSIECFGVPNPRTQQIHIVKTGTVAHPG